ncbi:MAG: hypothetical protein BIFFINMI_03950 [Phycisphaerae bacterium]|nr:hypothetical protein [Phycisphaerae bacterium]
MDQYADGMNLYQYVVSNPARFTDPYGLWSGDDHTALTKASFDQAFPIKVAGKLLECKNHIVDRLVAANLSQDKGQSFKENKRHYNRNINQAPAQADAAYTTYLAQEIKTFEDGLGKVKWQCVNKDEQATCGDALNAIGRLAHSWQDFYAHAVLLNDNGRPASQAAWAAGIRGTPDNLNPKLKPSSWGGVWNTGEHGGLLDGEPSDRDKPGGRQWRYNDARDFVADKFKKHLSAWYVKCNCCCPPRW